MTRFDTSGDEILDLSSVQALAIARFVLDTYGPCPAWEGEHCDRCFDPEGEFGKCNDWVDSPVGPETVIPMADPNLTGSIWAGWEMGKPEAYQISEGKWTHVSIWRYSHPSPGLCSVLFNLDDEGNPKEFFIGAD